MRKSLKKERIFLNLEMACIPGVGDGYTTPAFKRLVMGGVGQNIPYNQIEFDPATEEAGWWGFALPKNFLREQPIKVRVHWIAETAIAGDVVLGISVLGREEGEVFDAALGTEVEVTDTTQDVAGEMTTTEITLTPAQHALAPGDVVTLQLARKAANAADTLAEDADVVMVDLEIAVRLRG